MKQTYSHKLNDVPAGSGFIEPGSPIIVPPDMLARWAKELAEARPMQSGYPVAFMTLQVNANCRLIFSPDALTHTGNGS